LNSDTTRAIARASRPADGLAVAEARLPKSDAFNQTLMDAMPDCVKVLDASGCVIHINGPGLYAMEIDDFGTVCGQPWATLWPSDARDAVQGAVAKALAGEVSSFQAFGPTAKGSPRWWDVTVTPIREADQGSIQLLSVARNITERMRIAAESQGVAALLDTLLHTAPIGFCFIDRDLRFVRINERLAAINGSSVESHLGRHVSEIVPSLLETIRDVTNRILATGEAVLNREFSGAAPAAPGVTRFWSESWYPVRDGAGEISGFGAVVEEITPRKQMEDALRESDLTLRVLDNNRLS